RSQHVARVRCRHSFPREITGLDRRDHALLCGTRVALLADRLTQKGHVMTAQLDLATIVKMSEAISSEIVLDKLLARLVTLAVEHASDARVLLILSSRGEHHIAAEAVAGEGDVAVRLGRAVIDESMLAGSIVDHVARTRDRVVVDDASQPGPFAGD